MPSSEAIIAGRLDDEADAVTGDEARAVVHGEDIAGLVREDAQRTLGAFHAEDIVRPRVACAGRR